MSDSTIKTILPAKLEERISLQLRALRLEGVCFRYAGQYLRDSIDMKTIEHLQLVGCGACSPLLQMISQHCPILRSFALEDCYGSRFVPAINRFLQSISPKWLIVGSPWVGFHYADDEAAFDFRVLVPYASTMECLVVDDMTPGHPLFDREGRTLTDFLDLCMSLQSLQQLCIASPIIEGRDPDFLPFLVCMRSEPYVNYTIMPSTNQPCRIVWAICMRSKSSSLSFGCLLIVETKGLRKSSTASGQKGSTAP